MLLNYINGEFVKAASGKTEKLINPATEEVIDEMAWGDANDCKAAIDAAQRLRGAAVENGDADRRNDHDATG